MQIYLHQGHYWGDTDNEYNSTQVYRIWIKHTEEGIFVIKEDKSASSKRHYKHINDLFKNWGMLYRDCHNTTFK